MWRRWHFCVAKQDEVIEVESELNEFDLTSAESKADYKEIQVYVLKEQGGKSV